MAILTYANMADMRAIAIGHLRSALRWVRASRRVSVASRSEYAALALGQYRTARGMLRVLARIDPAGCAHVVRRTAIVARVVDDALRSASDGVRVAIYGGDPLASP